MNTRMPSSSFFSADTQLLELVIRGDADCVRRYFDEGVAGRKIARPTWQHLRIALEQHNRTMARLLVTWGAHPTRQELAGYFAQGHDAATTANALHTLKLAGVNVTSIDLGIDIGIATAAFNMCAGTLVPDDLDEDLIPEQWKTMLNHLAQVGAPEAVIAGGALRDLYNGRPIKSVDIFIKAPMMTGTFMRRLTLQAQPFAQEFKKGKWVHALRIPKRLGARDPDKYFIGDPLDRTETWRIHARPDDKPPHVTLAFTASEGVVFNIIMLGSDLGSDLRKDFKTGGDHGVRALLARFDFGLCQIAYRRGRVIATDAYRHDARAQRLTLLDPLGTTMEHIAAIVGKYPDFTPNEKLAEILRAGKTPPRPVQTPVMFSSRAFM